MKSCRGVVLLASFTSAALAQTFIVDAANGPGTNFTDIAAAVAAVPDGAVLEVRAGNYASFTIAGKGLSVLFDYLAIAADVVVTASLPHQVVLLRGLQMSSGVVSLANCQGMVLLDECVGIGGTGLTLQATGCDQLYATQCRIGGPGGVGAVMHGSTAVFRGGEIRGFHALQATACRIQLVECSVAAGNMQSGSPSGPAIWLNGGDVRIVGGACMAWQHPCISGIGLARIDPNVAFTQMPVIIEPTVQTIVAQMPAVIAFGGALGSNVYASIRGPIGEFGALLVGLPGPQLPLPGFPDTFWLQPGTAVTSALGVLPVNVSYAIPNAPVLRGLRLVWQGVSYGATNGLQASNPAITTHW